MEKTVVQNKVRYNANKTNCTLIWQIELHLVLILNYGISGLIPCAQFFVNFMVDYGTFLNILYIFWEQV